MYSLTTSMATSGVLPAVVTSLQVEYGFSSVAMGVVLALNDAIMTVLSIPVGFYGVRFNKARVAAWGYLASTIGIFLFALPYVAAPAYHPTTAATLGMCVPGREFRCALPACRCHPARPQGLPGLYCNTVCTARAQLSLCRELVRRVRNPDHRPDRGVRWIYAPPLLNVHLHARKR